MADAEHGESLAFFVDEDLPPRIAELLQAADFVATSVLAERRLSFPDEEQLKFATAHRLVMVTANIRDFTVLAREWAERDQAHHGIVFVPIVRFPRRDAAAIARALRELAARETREQLQNSARFLFSS